MTAPVIGSTRVAGWTRRVRAFEVVHQASPSNVRIRLPAASLIADQRGGMTVVLSFCSTIAGPAKVSPTGSRRATIEGRLERLQLAVDAEHALADRGSCAAANEPPSAALEASGSSASRRRRSRGR